jgi:hypothetical protein
LKMDDLAPQNLWEEKGPDYSAPYDEVLGRVARWLEAERQELWDRNTAIKHPWFLSRKAGLRAWSKHEARLRLSPFYRDHYTAADYHELSLLEKIQNHGDRELKDPYWTDLISFKTQTEGLSFLDRITEKAKLKPVQHQAVHCLFCCCWDRFDPPFEFWTYPAMVARFCEILRSNGAADNSVSEGNLRQLVRRFNLKKSKHIIVSRFVAGKIERFDEKAAAAAGLPKDVDCDRDC